MKISIIGAGMVGTEICSYLFMMGTAREIVLVDLDKNRAEGEVMDFHHMLAFTHTKNIKLTAGDYCDTESSDIIIITAGAQVKPGQTREDLAQINSKIVSSIAANIYKYSPDGIVIVVTNPVDVCTYFVLKNTGYDPKKVISSGTLLDSARFMTILAEHVKMDPKNIFGYVLGEHGSTSFIPWSICNICGINPDIYCSTNNISPVDKNGMLESVLKVGYEIFGRKGNTNHGIAASVYRIVRAIELNEHSMLPVGFLLDGIYGVDDVVLSLPVIVNKNGIGNIINYNLAEDEIELLNHSARQVKKLIAAVEQ